LTSNFLNGRLKWHLSPKSFGFLDIVCDSPDEPFIPLCFFGGGVTPFKLQGIGYDFDHVFLRDEPILIHLLHGRESDPQLYGEAVGKGDVGSGEGVAEKYVCRVAGFIVLEDFDEGCSEVQLFLRCLLTDGALLWFLMGRRPWLITVHYT
jgi:hypothetical protein